MLMVIVGAGASYDSAISRPLESSTARGTNRLPLANSLFEERKVFFEAFHNHQHFGPIVHRLRSLNGRGIEEVLEEISLEGESYPHRRVQLLAIRYYLKSAIGSCAAEWLTEVDRVTNYRILFDLIRQYKRPGMPVVIVTFNYDLLLEDALGLEMRYQFPKIDSYAQTQQEFSLFKMHGSTNWSRFVNTPQLNYSQMISLAETDGISETEMIMLDGEAVNNKGYAFGYIPAIAIPLQSKLKFECPDDHCRNLEKVLPKVKRVLTIGWRGLEQHFIDMLNNHLGALESLLVVSKGDAQTTGSALTAKLFARAVGRMALTSFEDGFSKFINRPSVIRDFLK
jgi:SIR2-like domain